MYYLTKISEVTPYRYFCLQIVQPCYLQTFNIKKNIRDFLIIIMNSDVIIYDSV